MKILLISSNSSGTGGGEYYLIFLAQGLCALGHEVHALLSQHAYMDGWAYKLTQAGAVVHRLPLKAHLDRPLRFVQAALDFSQQIQIREFCRKLAPDIVHTNHQFDEDGLDLPLAVRSIAPHIATIHLPMCASKDKRPLGGLRGGVLRNWYQRFAYPKIFVSEQARGEFTQYYPGSGLSYAIPNGVIHGQAAASERWRDGYSKDFTIGFSGRLNFQKDPLLLAQAWLLVRQSLPQCRLVIAGDGEMRPAVESLLRANAPEGGWEILGWLEDPAQLQAAYARFDLMILASLFESAVPLVLMETATQGIPTVALSIPQYQEFRSLLPMMELVEGRSPQLLAEAIVREYHQQRLLKAVTPTVLTAIRDYFSVSRMARLTIEAYQDAIAKSCGSVFESKACPSLD